MTDDVLWPDPEPVAELAARFRLNGQDARRAHLAHEGTGGDPACEWCVFTEDGYQTHNCRSCTRSIVWATTENGNVMPVDASPDPEGNVVLSRRHDLVRVTVLDQDALFDDGVRRTSHFATCPDADKWRAKR